MEDLRFSDMMKMQYELWEKHKDEWNPLEPQYARNSMLWIIEELGEAIAVIKKKGDSEIMNNPDVRKHYVEELSDVLMFFNDMLLSYNITPDELSQAYIDKHNCNMNRDFKSENDRFI
jgi:NTP pyrophosphatase (non-canonical NTP hydrolase)